MLRGANTNCPRFLLSRTSYLKSIDIWLIVCFLFTFATLIEYCLVLYLVNSSDWYDSQKAGGKRHSKALNSKQLRLGYFVEKWCGIVFPLLFFAFIICYTANNVSTKDFLDMNFLKNVTYEEIPYVG